MSETEKDREGSESMSEMEDEDTLPSASCDSSVASVARESGRHDFEASEMVSGHRTQSETQEPAGPSSGTRLPGDGATKSMPHKRQMPSTQTRDTPVKVEAQPAADSQGDPHALRESVDIPQPSDLSSRTHARSLPSIQKQVDQNKQKKGICILCACTNAHCTQERIEPSDAVERMRKCFGDKLGYLVIQVGTTIMSQNLDEVLQELSQVRLPPSYCRVFFYYFGHGTEKFLCLADRNIERKYIIERLQSMCPSHPVDLFKIFLFDSCRTISALTTHAIPVRNRGPAGELGGGGGGDGQTWQTKWKYPSSSNTLVINATDFSCRAYYIDDAQVHGCGLVTLYFTDLVPKLNASLSEVLTEVRKKVDTYIKTHPNDVPCPAGDQCVLQVLVYEDRLMGCVNLLAESTGNARVSPEKVTTCPQALNTNVHWRFGWNVENRIQNFTVEVTPDGDRRDVYRPAPVRAPSNERFASLSSLKPSTTYRVKVAAEYKDGFRAESEDSIFTTSDRSPPQNVKFTRQHSGSSEAIVEWSFPGDAAELSCYKVKVQFEREQSVKLTITDVQEKRATLNQLPLSSKYTVSVTAVYKDGIEKESSAEFFSGCDPKAATDMSAAVIWLNSLKVELKWSYEREENAPLPTSCTVVVKPVNSISQPIEIPVSPHIHQAALELRHNITYSWKVVTIYGQNTKRESEEMEFTTPSEEEVKPIIEETENIQSNSVVVTFSSPQFIQKMEEFGDHVKLTGYTVMRQAHGDQEDDPKRVEFPYNVPSTSASHASPAQPHRMKLAGLMPGKKYKLTVTAHYSNGESIPSDEGEFTTKLSVQRICCFCASILLPLLPCLLLILAIVPYCIYLQGSGDCQVNYILSIDTIQCGYGNSLQYDGAEIKGCPVAGDVMTETLNVWQIHDNELKLYSQTLDPVLSNGQTTDHSTFLLLGWQIYTWIDSTIAGFCCIANDNKDEQTASLHMFRHSEDAFRFENGEGARNAIFSEQIRVPPKKTTCFRKWGSNSPFTVTHSSYHYIGVDLPAGMNYTANITVTQTYVNISDYPNAKPKQFRRDNHTHFSYPHSWFHRKDYLYICKAPLIYPEHKSEPDSVSLHVCTCNEPYPWMEPIFISIPTLGGLGMLYVLISFICYCLYIKRHRLCGNHHGQCCPCFRNSEGYARLREQSTIQV